MPDVADGRPDRRGPSRVRSFGLLFAAVCLIAVNLRATITGVGPLLAQISADTGQSLAVLGALTSVPLIVWAICSPFAHGLSRRFGLGRAVLIALIALAAGTVVRSVPGSTANLWIGTLIIGMALALANVLMPAVVRRGFGARVNVMTSLYTALLAGCGAIASGIVVPLSHVPMPDGGSWGWRVALLLTGSVVPIAIVLWVLHTRRVPEKRMPPVVRAQRGPTVWRDPVAWQIGFYMGLQSIVFYMLATWLAPYSASTGRSEAVGGADAMIYQLFGIVGALGLSSVLRGGLTRWVPAILPVMSSFGIVGLMLAPGSIIGWLILPGLGSGASLAMSMSLMASRARDHNTASALSGMAQTVGYVIGACGPMAFGWLLSASGGWTAPFSLVLLALAGQCVVGIVVGREHNVFDALENR
ncbi:MFS transporter [Okibacterium endophyticum]